MADAVIIDAVRTPIGRGKPNGALAGMALNVMGVACLTGAAYAAYTGPEGLDTRVGSVPRVPSGS